MDLATTFQHVVIALGLGLLVGLQRERAGSAMGGIRTFPLITILGVVCAVMAQTLGGWILAAGFASLAALLVAAHVSRPRQDTGGAGLTTEIAALLMFGVGAYLVVGQTEVALAIGGGVAVLLQLKQPMHAFVRRMGDADVKAIMQFALISLVVLPVLPDATYGPFDVFNPRRAWLFVVLIVAIRLIGYVAYKLFGARVGTLLSGVLGGLISSTATTMSQARISRTAPDQSTTAALVITIASAVVFIRVIVLVAVTAPSMIGAAAGPLGCMFAVLALVALVLWLRLKDGEQGMPDQANPTELKSAIMFALLYVAVLFAVAAVQEYVGQRGLYVVAAVSGLTDMDAITLSTAQMQHSGQVSAEVVWRLILIAAMSNLVFKTAVASVLGHRQLAVILSLVSAAALTCGGLLLALWPATAG